MPVRTVDNPYDPDPYTVDPPADDFFAANPAPTQGNGGLGPVTSTGYKPPPYTGDVAAWIRQVRGDLGLRADQNNHAALQTLVDLAAKAGAPIQMDEIDSNGHLGGLIINGQKQQLIDGSNNWTDPTPWPAESSGGGSSSGGTFSYPAFNETFSYPTWDQHFQAPTADSLSQDPGFTTRLKEGQKALERSAASKGTLLTGGTLKGIVDFGQQMASQEYGNVYNRDRMQYESNYNDYLGNYGRALGEFGQKAGLQNQGYQQALGTYQQARSDQNQQFGQLFNMANFGADNAYRNNSLDYNYAQLYGNTLMGGTTQGNDYNLQGANANAAGRVGSGNAWGNAFSNAANPAWNALFYSNLMGKTPPPTSRGY